MKRILLWGLFWLFLAFGFLVALDNLVFQPVPWGIIIGGITAFSMIFLLRQVRIWRVTGAQQWQEEEEEE